MGQHPAEGNEHSAELCAFIMLPEEDLQQSDK